MVLNDAIIDEARSWVDTPYHHQGRLKGVGVDCVGLVIGVGRALGICSFEFFSYERSPDPTILLGHLREQLTRGNVPQRGSILLFSFTREPQHFGIYTGVDDTIIHAYSCAKKVEEAPFDIIWKRRMLSVHEYKEVAWHS